MISAIKHAAVQNTIAITNFLRILPRFAHRLVVIVKTLAIGGQIRMLVQLYFGVNLIGKTTKFLRVYVATVRDKKLKT